MTAARKFSTLIFALCFAVGLSGPCIERCATNTCVRELAKLGKDLFQEYKKATQLSSAATKSYNKSFPGIPECTFLKASNRSEMCDILQPFRAVFEDFKSSVRYDVVNSSDKSRLEEIISRIQEENCLNCEDSSTPPSRPPSQNLGQAPYKIMLYNTFEKYQNCTEKLLHMISSN